MGGRSFHNEETGQEASVAIDERGYQTFHSRLHKEIHDGRAYSAGHLFEAVADDANADILFQVGATLNDHITFGLAASGDSYVALTEDVIVSSSGTAMGVPNKNRASANTADTNAWYTPTVVSVGTTTLFSGLLPGGTGGNAVGGTAAERDEWVLAKGKFYLLRVINKAGNAKDISSQATFYEAS